MFRILFLQIREFRYKANRCSLGQRQPYPIWLTRCLVVQMVLVIIPLETRVVRLLRVVQNLLERRDDGREKSFSSRDVFRQTKSATKYPAKLSKPVLRLCCLAKTTLAKDKNKSSSFLRKHGRMNFFA